MFQFKNESQFQVRTFYTEKQENAWKIGLKMSQNVSKVWSSDCFIQIEAEKSSQVVPISISLRRITSTLKPL